AALAAADKLGGDRPSPAEAQLRLREALEDGGLKIMSKLGIADVASYRGARLFEAIGLADDVVETCLAGTPSSIGGIGLAELGRGPPGGGAGGGWGGEPPAWRRQGGGGRQPAPRPPVGGGRGKPADALRRGNY